MELRPLTQEDQPALGWLMSEAFGGGRRPQDDGTEALPERLQLGVFEGARLVAAATVLDLHVTWGDQDAPMGGVAGVACTVGERGRGHVARLMAQSLRRMREAGQYLSGLYPFSFAFYRRHGWDWVGEKRRYRVPTHAVPAAPEGRDVRMYDGPEALEVVKPVYAAFARRHRGMTTRQDPVPDWWTRTLEHGGSRTTYVHVHHDPVTGEAGGYFTFRYPERDQPARLGEFFANTPSAYRGLLSVMHYYGTQLSHLEFVAPADDPLPLHVMHHDLSATLSPLFMGRVVDVPAALSALRPPPEAQGRLALRVRDDACDWNDGTFAVAVEGGRIAVTTATAPPGVTLDIQALTQAYWGQPALSLLRYGGRLNVADDAQFSLLSALLPPAICYLQDHF
ncbi:MAG: GNAT family N-acetyltransferase [Armatimonadetes bacterium]|nr:GNAT family N-acetyltransferase [Armatimonadota bacterium]